VKDHNGFDFILRVGDYCLTKGWNSRIFTDTRMNYRVNYQYNKQFKLKAYG
jgi:hypothetical protein